jgi:hypothetical protein
VKIDHDHVKTAPGVAVLLLPLLPFVMSPIIRGCSALLFHHTVTVEDRDFSSGLGFQAFNMIDLDWSIK